MMKKEYVADPGTLCGAERFLFTDGKAKGTEGVRLYNGRLDLTVIPDRCMDIFRLFYRGTPVSYISKNGLVSPRLTESVPYGFLRSFDAGFLYTCGLDNIGAPEVRDGVSLPQHGSVSYLPAENLHTEVQEENGTYTLILHGTMRYTALFGQNLVMRRQILLPWLADEVTVRDEITNEGYTAAEYLLMYHTNLGYPLLSEDTTLSVAAARTVGISPVNDPDACLRFEAPAPGRAEEVFRHDLTPGKRVQATATGRHLAVALEFDTADFPYMLEWKSMACGDYVLGLEPVTTPMPEKKFRTLKPGESATHTVTWRFSEK